MTRYQNQIDHRFAALADPTRRAMVERLSRGATPVSDLAAPFNMALPTVMQHLKVLEASGLIRSSKTGRVRTCELDPAALRGIESWLAAQVLQWESRLDRLDELALRLAQQEELTEEKTDD